MNRPASQFRLDLTTEETLQLLLASPRHQSIFIWSPPGCGKTGVVHEAARLDTGGDPSDPGAEVITLRASELAPHDIVGVPTVFEAGYTTFNPLKELVRLTKAHSKGDTRPKWLFLDELSQAQPDLLSSYLYLTFGRVLGGLGGLELADNVRIVAAGNYASDGSMCHDLPTALGSRFLHVHLRPNLQEWLVWARRNGVYPRILAFLQQNESRFHDFDPTRDGETFPCPRTWTMLSDVLLSLDARGVTSSRIRQAAILGTVGAGAGTEYHRFEELAIHAPTRDQIAADPKGTPVPDTQPDVALVILENLLAALREDAARYADPAILYVSRMHREFRTLFAQRALGTDQDMPAEAIQRVLQSKHFPLLQDCLARMSHIMAEVAA